MSETNEKPKKISAKEQFELCYLRHRYLKKVEKYPTEQEMAPYMDVVKNLARNTFFRYKHIFAVAGLHLEDVINIAYVHLLSFLGLFSLQKMEDKYQEFVKKYTAYNFVEPDEQAILDKNKANLTMFMKQRMEDVVRICRQKSKNIKGLQIDDYIVFYGPEYPPDNLQSLLYDNNHTFKKVDQSFYRTIKKKQKIKSDVPFKFAGYWYVAVPLEKRNLSMVDFEGADMNPSDNLHHKNPEQILLDKEDEDKYTDIVKTFKAMPKLDKVSMLRDFIAQNFTNVKMKEEVKIARQMLRRMRM